MLAARMPFKVIKGYKRDVLNILARLQYATVTQISYWSDGRHISRTYASLNDLEDAGLVTVHKAIQPYIYSITREGYRIAGEKPPAGSRLESWSVLTHRCHRNEAEIRLREHYPDFKFLSRIESFPYGVNPSFGEHFGLTGERRFFILLDDYFMGSSRIGHVWTRTHRPNKNYFDVKKKENVVPTWSMLATDYVVASTDENQYQLHKAYIKKHSMNAMLLKIEGLW